MKSGTGRRHTALALIASLWLGCSSSGSTMMQPVPPPGGSTVRLVTVATGIGFPVDLKAPSGDPRLFVVDKRGTIWIIRDGQVLAEPFLDIRALVSGGSERGLLSMAFHPAYASNGRFFVDYTDVDGDTRVVEYRVSADPDRADPDPIRTILHVAQPFTNHNGGLVVFGPDGRLYVGLGDGGSAGDPQEHGQNTATLLGSILRIDIDGAAPYEVPPDNPFVGEPRSRPEIWAYGVRNPWRFAFDQQTGQLFVADVGQSAREEVNAVDGRVGGINYGWNITEGTRCFRPAIGCATSGLEAPVLDYSHDEGCSVTGGFVYRGAALPELDGLYFYSDFCAGFVRSFRLVGDAVTEHRDWPDLAPPEGGVTAFGQDGSGELYVLTSAGNVHRIAPGL